MYEVVVAAAPQEGGSAPRWEHGLAGQRAGEEEGDPLPDGVLKEITTLLKVENVQGRVISVQ